MNANDKFYARDAHVDAAAIAPLPNARKIFVRGIAAGCPRADARDRAIRHAGHVRRREEPADRRLRHVGPVHGSGGGDRHPQGTAGAARSVDRRARRHGRARRADVRVRPRAARRSGARRHALRPAAQAARARSRAPTSRRCTTRAAASSRRRWSSSRSAKICSARRCSRRCRSWSRASIRAQSFGAAIPPSDHARVRARRGRARPRDHPGEHQPPGVRADDHRPQLPGEDQRQHRQLGGVARRSTRRSRSCAGRRAGAPTR